MTVLDDLERLAKAATPGPFNDEDGAIVNRKYNEEGWDIGEIYALRNRSYIVALLNAAPALLACVRVAKEYIDAADNSVHGDQYDDVAAMLRFGEADKAIRAALAKLEKESCR